MEAQGDGVDHLMEGQLVEQGIPIGIIVALADHAGQSQAVIGTQGGHLDGISQAAVITGDGEVGGQRLVGSQLCGSGREGAVPVRAAQPGNGTGVGAALVGVSLIKQVGDGGAALAGGEGGGVEDGVVPDVGQVDVAVGGHAAVGALNGVALGSQDVVHSVVAVGADGEVVVTGIQDVGLGVVGIVGAQLTLRNVDGDILGSAGGQYVGLGEAAQLSGSLFDAVGLVVVGVGALEVDLHGLLAGVGGAGVGDSQVDVEAVSILGHAEVAVIEGGVAVAVAEGIGNGGRPIIVADIGGAHDGIFVAGLVVTVVEVDALLVDAVHTLHVSTVGHQVVIGGIGVSLGVEVVHGGVSHVVVQIGIDHAAGRSDLTGEQLGHTVDAGLAHVADPHSGVDAVVLAADLRVQEVQLNGVGGVDQDDDLLEGAVVLQGLEVCEQFLLFSRQSEVVAVALLAGDPGVAGAVLTAGQVSALAAGAGEHDDSSVAVLGKAGLSAGELAPGSLVDGILSVGFEGVGDSSRGNAAVVLHHVIGAVQVPQRLVDGDALALESLLEAGSLGGIDGAGAGAAVHQVNRTVTEQADLGTAGQRQRSVVVLQQGSALGLNLCAESLFVSGALLVGGKIALEVLGITRGLALDDLVGRCTEVVVHGGGVVIGNGGANDRTCGQHCGNARQGAPQRNAVALFLLCHVSLLLGKSINGRTARRVPD